MKLLHNFSMLNILVLLIFPLLSTATANSPPLYDIYPDHDNYKKHNYPRDHRVSQIYGKYAPYDQDRGFTRPDWATATQKAKDFLNGWTNEELVTLTSGIGWAGDKCVGNIAAIPSRNFPGLCLEDSPLGVRFADRVSVFPAGINTAATFSRKLIHQRGVALGQEFRGKGVHIALGPMMNMGRVPEGGRNFEGFGADPYLAGEAAFETVAGMQSQGVQACAKHFLNNEQEHGRRTTTSDVSDRVQHEFYLHPFLRSVQAGVASIMCSYNQINGTYACDHNDTLNTYLKGQLGFEGYVMSDWDAKHDTKSANNGLDMTMPGSIQSDGTDKYFGNRLVKAVEAGTVPRERLEDMAIRIVAAWFAVGQDQDYPEVNFDAFNRNSPANQHIDVQDDHAQLIRKIGAASTVLLKNEKGALPLVQPGTVALIGSDAGPSIRGPNWFQDRAGLDGILAQGWGSGTADYPYLVSPLEALQSRARDEHTTVSWFIEDYDLSGASQTATDKDVAIVFVAANSGEEYLTVDGNVGDRNNLTSWTNGEELVKAVASHNNNTIVVVHSVGPILMPWADHENITAIVWAGVPGQEAGSSLVDVLYGDWNPSGRLPYTIARAEQDYKTRIEWNKHEVPYDEGLNVDYRQFDAHDIEPLFEFGFGLSYTRFEYFGLHTAFSDDSAPEAENWRAGLSPSGSDTVGSSIQEWLHRKIWTVKFKLQNVGMLFGAEAPQLYISFPTSAQSPPRVLKGFDSVHLQPGETKIVEFSLSRYDLSIWNVEKQAWVAPEPNAVYGLHVGSSSRNFRLSDTLSLEQ